MPQRNIFILLFVTLVIGFAVGFFLRPLISPIPQTDMIATTISAVPMSSGARGTQYFVAHIDEARRIVAGCRNGSVRGSECGTAEEAIIKVDAAGRRKRFLGN